MDRRRVLPIAATVALLGSAVIGAVHYAGGSPAERGPEGILGSLAVAAVLAGPSLVALIAARRAPRLLIGAGTVLVAVGFLMSIATWPFAVAGAIYVAVGADRDDGETRMLIAGFGIAALTAAAVLALFLREDPRSWSSVAGSGSTSDVVSYTEAMTSLVLSGLAIAAAAWSIRRRVASD